MGNILWFRNIHLPRLITVCNIISVIVTGGAIKSEDNFSRHQQQKFNCSFDLQPFTIALEIFGWFDFVVIRGNKSEGDMMYRSGRHTTEEDENFKSMKEYYGAQIEIADLRIFPTGTFIETPPDSTLLHSSTRKFHFICFVDPNEFLLLISKISNISLHSMLIIIPLTGRESYSTEAIFSEWKTVFTTFPLNVDSEMYFALESIPLKTLTIYEYYKINAKLTRKHICTIGSNDSCTNNGCIIDKYQRRQDLEGTFFNVIGVDVQPFYANLNVDPHANNTRIYGGMIAETFLALAKDLNLTYSLTILNGYKYGVFKNGSWDGMIGSLSRNENDFTVSEVSLAADRFQYMDFTMSFDSVGRKMYIRKTHQEKKINWQFYSNPFSTLLHVSVALFASTLTLFLWAFVKLSNANIRADGRIKLEFSEASWITLSCLCQKGSNTIPNGRSPKIVFIVIYFTSLIMFACYSATLTSQLSVAPPVKLPFNDLAGLVMTPKDWLGGPIKGDLSHVYMEKTCPEILSNAQNKDDPNIQCKLLTQMWTKVVHKNAATLPTSFEEGLNKVLSGKFAFIASSTGTRYRINNDLNEEKSCQVHEMAGDYVLSNLAFGMKRKNPYKLIINYKLLKMWQSGALKRLKNVWVPQRKVCTSNQPTDYTDITIYEIAVAVLIVIFGGLFSAFLLIIELLLKLQKEKPNFQHTEWIFTIKNGKQTFEF